RPGHPVEHRVGLLRGGAAIEEDQPVAVDFFRENREIGADGLEIKGHGPFLWPTPPCPPPKGEGKDGVRPCNKLPSPSWGGWQQPGGGVPPSLPRQPSVHHALQCRVHRFVRDRIEQLR